MITDWIGRREALLPINQNYDKIRETNNLRLSAERLNVVVNAEKHSSLLNKVQRNSARKIKRTVQLQARRVHCPIGPLQLGSHDQIFPQKFLYYRL